MPKYPKDLEIRRLKPEEWHLVEKTYTEQFGNAMPQNSEQSTFVGVFLGEKLVGFAHLESVFHLNAVYLEPEHRNANYADALFETMKGAMSPGYPVIILPDKNLIKLIESHGFRSLGKIDVFRREF